MRSRHWRTGKALLFLCPKQTFALTACELARFVALPAAEDTSYVQACLNAKRPDLIYGQSCPKHYHFRIHGTPARLGAAGVTERKTAQRS